MSFNSIIIVSFYLFFSVSISQKFMVTFNKNVFSDSDNEFLHEQQQRTYFAEVSNL